MGGRKSWNGNSKLNLIWNFFFELWLRHCFET